VTPEITMSFVQGALHFPRIGGAGARTSITSRRDAALNEIVATFSGTHFTSKCFMMVPFPNPFARYLASPVPSQNP
jgi:hypothetical protein